MYRYLIFSIELLFGIHKTIYINIRFFGFRGLLLPIWISKNTVLRSLSGQIRLAEFRSGVVKVGFSNVDAFDGASVKCIFKNTGSILFKGRAFIGQGATFESTGMIEIGRNFRITANSVIICKNRMKFGENVLISWGCQLSDSDFHKIIHQGRPCKIVGEVILGDKVWICANSTICKNVKIGSDCVVGAGSVCVSNEFESGSLICGNPARVVRSHVKWDY